MSAFYIASSIIFVEKMPINIRCIVCNKKIKTLSEEQFEKEYKYKPPKRVGVLFDGFCSEKCKKIAELNKGSRFCG